MNLLVGLVIYQHLNNGVVVVANKSDEKIFKVLLGIACETVIEQEQALI
jgi:hypothetical protein